MPSESSWGSDSEGLSAIEEGEQEYTEWTDEEDLEEPEEEMVIDGDSGSEEEE